MLHFIVLIAYFNEVVGFKFHSADVSSQSIPIRSGPFALKWGELLLDALLFTEYVFPLRGVLI